VSKKRVTSSDKGRGSKNRKVRLAVYLMVIFLVVGALVAALCVFRDYSKYANLNSVVQHEGVHITQDNPYVIFDQSGAFCDYRSGTGITLGSWNCSSYWQGTIKGMNSGVVDRVATDFRESKYFKYRDESSATDLNNIIDATTPGRYSLYGYEKGTNTLCALFFTNSNDTDIKVALTCDATAFVPWYAIRSAGA